MLQPDVDFAKSMSPGLTVTHQETGALQALHLSAGQLRVMTALRENERVVVLKGRQVFVSTCCCLFALLFALINPGVKVALVADIKEKAEGLLAKVGAWAIEAGIPTKPPTNTRVVTLWNGAELHAITANSKDTGSKEVKAGRTFSYGLIVLSEFAYYTRDAALLSSITRSALKGARIIIETTATPAENAFRSIWERGKGWKRVFLSFEEHEAYQLPVDSRDVDGELVLDDAMWAELREKYGFASRTHATYWWRMVQTDMDGDVHRGLREAPIKPEHAFAFAEGRWIFAYEPAEPTSTDGAWSFYEDADESGCIFGVDTGAGLGADSSTIAVIGRAHGNLLATFHSNTTKVPDFIPVVRAAMARWKPFATIIEGNGIGKGVYQAVANVPGANVLEHTSTDAEKPTRMNLVRLAIESGQVVAGPELEHEVKHSMMLRPRKSGGGPLFDGPDDLLNALGFALVARRDRPWHPRAVPVNPRTHVDRSAYRKRKQKKGVF